MQRDFAWVLHICHSYYPPFLDCARQYASLFKGSPYKVLTVYLTGTPDDAVIQGSASDEVIFLGFNSREVSGLKLGAIAKIRQIVSQREFKLCIAHRVKPTYAALLATHLPVVSVHHNYNDYSRWSRRLLVNFYRNRLLMLGVSDSVRDDLRRDLKGWPENRIQTLYNRIDVEATKQAFVSKEEARNALGLPQDAWVIGNVGRLHHDKDQATLLRGFKLAQPELPANTKLVIVGKGPLEADLKRLTAELGINDSVVFTGNVPNAKRYFKAFDVFALTSDHEPFGMVLLEAMAAEIPLICSNSGGGAEVVRDIGLLFVLGDADALADRLLETYQHRYYVDTRMAEKLADCFSDEAAREVFWQLPLVRAIVES